MVYGLADYFGVMYCAGENALLYSSASAMVGWRMMVIVEGVVDVDDMGIYPGVTPDITPDITRL